MEYLDFLLLNVLSLRAKEIKSGKQVYEFEELRLYTKDEITESSVSLKEKGWIKYFRDGDCPPCWHMLLDEGRIALRNYIEQHPEISNGFVNIGAVKASSDDDENLIKALLPLFYGEDFIHDVRAYIMQLRQIQLNREKVSYTATLVNDSIISPDQCRRPLWKILNQYGLYPLTEGCWNRTINKHLNINQSIVRFSNK